MIKTTLRNCIYSLCIGCFTVVINAQNPALQLTNANNNFVQWDDTNTLIESNPDFTIEMWVKGTASTNGKMIYCEGANSNNNMFRLYASGGKIVIRPNGTSTDQIVSTGLNVFSDTKGWTHIAITGLTPNGLGTQTTLNLYIDGVLNVSGTYTRIANDHTRTVLGNLTRTTNQTSAYAFNGEIDEFRTWSKALTENELAINKCSLGNTTNLVRHVRFNESSGTTVYDEVAASNAVIQGASLVWTTNSACSSDLVAYYPFNGNANDESVNTNNGVVSGATLTTDRSGTSNSAYAFNGTNDYIQIPDSNVFSIVSTSKLSISVWMRVDQLDFPSTQGDGYVHWMGKGVNGQHEWAFRMYNQSSARPNRTSAYVFNLSGGLGAGSYVEESVSVGQWMHFVVLYDYTTDTIKWYKNGQLMDTDMFSDYTIAPGNGTAPVRIGTRDFNSYFKGAIDDIRFYNGILTFQEITNLYNENKALSVVLKSPKPEIDLKFYPNPTPDILKVYNPKHRDMTYRVTDSYGRIVKHGILKDQIDLGEFPEGLYIISVKALGQTLLNKKIIKL